MTPAAGRQRVSSNASPTARSVPSDGGGSVSTVVNGKVINSPSDGTERAVGDALLLTR
jgi:exopolysaccharide biosynthesis protein